MAEKCIGGVTSYIELAMNPPGELQIGKDGIYCSAAYQTDGDYSNCRVSFTASSSKDQNDCRFRCTRGAMPPTEAR